LGALADLELLVLKYASFVGSIPSELGRPDSKLQTLDLQMNTGPINGTIPTQLGQCQSLVSMALNSNQLTGSIPSEFGNLVNLNELYLEQNVLTGAVPSELASLPALESLNLHQNELTGTALDDFFCAENSGSDPEIFADCLEAEEGSSSSLVVPLPCSCCEYCCLWTNSSAYDADGSGWLDAPQPFCQFQ
jgi:hypothetical protein